MPGARRSSATPEDPLSRLANLTAAIASEQPAPAGGSAGAAVVAIAAALVQKAARLSLRHWDRASAVRDRAHALRLHADELIEADVHAYLAYVEAARGTRGMDAESRERIIGPARDRTVEVPLAIARAAAEVADLAVELVVHGNPNLRSDAEVAGVLAAAGARAAVVTMSANLAETPRDRRLAEARRLARAASVLLRQPPREPASRRGRARARSRDSG